jgi:hypothetical protein
MLATHQHIYISFPQVILNIISESCVPLLKYAITDHHNETISFQVTHKTFVSHIESHLIEREYQTMSGTFYKNLSIKLPKRQ